MAEKTETDKELALMRRLLRTLEALDDSARKRVVAYLIARFSPES